MDQYRIRRRPSSAQSRSADGDRGEKLKDFKKETSALHFIRARKSFKKGEEKKQAEDIAKKIENIVLEIKVKAGESGKIFGSITSKEIADNLESQYKIKIDKKRINLKEPIKSLGSFTVEIRLFEGVIAKLKILIK